MSEITTWSDNWSITQGDTVGLALFDTAPPDPDPSPHVEGQTGERFCARMSSQTLAADDDKGQKGHVRALVSAYGVRYRIGWATYHTIEAGAFADSIAAQDAIPLFWQHAWDAGDPPIGHAGAEEDDNLVIDGGLYVDTDPTIARLHQAMKAGAIREWSIGYRVQEVRKDDDDEQHFFVTKAELMEASAVLRGANPNTETLLVASGLEQDATMTRDDFIAKLADQLGVTLADSAPIPTPEPDQVPAMSWDDLVSVRKLLG